MKIDQGGDYEVQLGEGQIGEGGSFNGEITHDGGSTIGFGFTTVDKSTQASQGSLHITVSGDDGVDISGAVPHNSKATLNIWNESGQLVYEELLEISHEGRYEVQLGECQIGEGGSFNGELIHEGPTMGFGFATADKFP